MKIAVASHQGMIFQHFGKCPCFEIFEVEGKEIKARSSASVIGSGHSALASFLKNLGVDTVICGGIGAGARDLLLENGMTLVSGASGSVSQAAADYLSGALTASDAATCDHHHGEESDHECHCENHCK